ncbi:MAG: RNA polymerase sigma-70 factor [Bacteroidales bacterium]|nr:RNA polymerase sigma-70 factor [Bacteroidales bacterium]MBR0314675.1 RNA polymerase sigma-70 factor [Bacteroidales bacterium]
MSSIGEKGSLVSELYGRHRSFLCFYAMGYVDSYAEAEDIVHSVFEKMLSMDISLKDTSAIDSYLISAVRNSCLNHISRKKVHGKYASHILSENEDSEDRGFVNSRIEAEILWEVFSKVEQLPHGCRQVFKLSYLEDLSNQEIADRLGISVNTVKSQKARSKELLKESLKDLFAVAAIIFGL